ncbi:hypothetical protein B0I35DRAFT_425873 [Stachybotrys elegans]|uniref:Ketoreductase (KR) domain-containing protein n=1 Tax=Stachybotrys elegans TaxID=80388 RepID=A0A8K0STW7_9HYPO|nr:hypothetical protein B0I35DRAFT_425873 [Stachybotrys elegans]
MSPKMPSTFDTSPEDESKLLHFFRRQLTFTPDDVIDVDLAGKTAIVIGSNCGVGLECCRKLLELGIGKLILTVRSKEKGDATLVELSKGKEIKPETIDIWQLELSSYDSVIAFGERARSLDRIDYAIISAAMMSAKQKLTPTTGHDEMIQVNYLSTMLVLLLLLAVVKEKPGAQPARITLVSSEGAAWTKFNERHNDPLLPSLDTAKGWKFSDRYFLSKLLGQIFVARLAEHVPASVAVVNMASPGLVHDTGLEREVSQATGGSVIAFLKRRFAYSSKTAARNIIDAVVHHGAETHGQFLAAQAIRAMAPIVYPAADEPIRERLWKETLAEFSQPEAQRAIQQLVV